MTDWFIAASFKQRTVQRNILPLSENKHMAFS